MTSAPCGDIFYSYEKASFSHFFSNYYSTRGSFEKSPDPSPIAMIDVRFVWALGTYLANF
jgi:hypothetical protein